MKHIVGFSGGIDSQATARYVLNRYAAEDVLILNSNAGGNEHPLTDEFVDWYSANVHPVIRINAILADMWKTPGFAETKGLDGGELLTFNRMMVMKKRAPSRCAQFCTELLKIRPQQRFIAEKFGVGGEFEGDDFRRYTGVRREESNRRAGTPWINHDDFYDCELESPIFDWTKQMCFDYVQAHGEQINPLYTLGFNRVGCAPCVNSSKEDIRAWADRFPEMIDKVREWENELRDVAGPGTKRTFFPPMVPGKPINTIDEVVAWAFTKHGGKELLVLPDRPSCESKYGLCA